MPFYHSSAVIADELMKAMQGWVRACGQWASARWQRAPCRLDK
jgi:hypothetical protein